VPAEQFPSASIIIPAHNEAGLIDRTLAPLDPLVTAGTAEVIVVPNGCSDDIADRARAHSGVRVVQLAEGSKAATLNAGDTHATRRPRLYLHADIEADTDRATMTAVATPTGMALASITGTQNANEVDASRRRS
jgi:glycosyltransferase involved in cell wall biosynthesis